MEALKTATLIDVNPLHFWELTPNEFSLMVKAYQERTQAKTEEKITLAYVTALWTAQWFGKKKPDKLSKILNQNKPTEMTPEDMLKEVKRLNAMFGGVIKYETPKEGR